MKIFADEGPKGEVAIFLEKGEGLALCKALERSMARKPDPKPMRTNDKVYKIACVISERLPVY